MAATLQPSPPWAHLRPVRPHVPVLALGDHGPYFVTSAARERPRGTARRLPERRPPAVAAPGRRLDDNAAVAPGWMAALAEVAEAGEAGQVPPLRRIAKDGNPHTMAEFMRIYGAGWSDAWGGAVPEERVDVRGHAGEFCDFVARYGARGARAKWHWAAGAHWRKLADDGMPYGLTEFIGYFGPQRGLRLWWAAPYLPSDMPSEVGWLEVKAEAAAAAETAEDALAAEARVASLGAPNDAEAAILDRAPQELDKAALDETPPASVQESALPKVAHKAFDTSEGPEAFWIGDDAAAAPSYVNGLCTPTRPLHPQRLEQRALDGCRSPILPGSAQAEAELHRLDVCSPSGVREVSQQHVEHRAVDRSEGPEIFWLADDSTTIECECSEVCFEFESDWEQIMYLEQQGSRLRRRIRALSQH